MRSHEFVNEVYTSLGRKYEELYIQYYKRAHRAARKQGLTGADADASARQALDRYKDRVRTGAWDPITRTAGQGRATYNADNQKLFDEKANTYSATQVLDYINKIHHDFKDSEYILSFPTWELTTVPLSSLMFDNDVDMNHVKTITKQAIKNKPIVVDIAGAIIDGNHRTAAASLMGLDRIPAFTPIDA